MFMPSLPCFRMRNTHDLWRFLARKGRAPFLIAGFLGSAGGGWGQGIWGNFFPPVVAQQPQANPTEENNKFINDWNSSVDQQCATAQSNLDKIDQLLRNAYNSATREQAEVEIAKAEAIQKMANDLLVNLKERHLKLTSDLYKKECKSTCDFQQNGKTEDINAAKTSAEKKRASEIKECTAVEVRKFLVDNFSFYCDVVSKDSNSVLAQARKQKNYASQEAEKAGTSIADARAETDNEVDVSAAIGSSDAAQAKLMKVVFAAEQCTALAAEGSAGASEKLQIASAKARDTECEINIRNQINALVNENFQKYNSCVSSFKKLESECSEVASSGWSTAGEITLYALGIGAIGTVGYLIGRNNGKSRGGGGGGGGGGGDGTDEKNPTTGACPTGQVKNVNGICVTPTTANPGTGSQTQTTNDITTGSPVNIGSPGSNDTLGSNNGTNQGAVGRNLAGPGSISGGGSSGGGSGGGSLSSGGGGSSSSASKSSGSSGGGGKRNLSGGGGYEDSFGDDYSRDKKDETGAQPSGLVTDSQFSSGKLYAYVVNNSTRYLPYAKCLKSAPCRDQNRDVVEKERDRIKNQRAKNRNLLK
jgi:hypothetical protein